MPYTTRDKVDLVQPGTTGTSGFYSEDISAVLNQPGANRVTNYIATLSNGSSNDEFSILIAVDKELELLNGADDLVALSCPPFDGNAGQFKANPELP